jgi:hypothetical protein
MPNIANILKSEISRLARKEMRENSDGLRKAVAAHRAEIAALKRRVQALEALVKRLAKGPVPCNLGRPCRVKQASRQPKACVSARREWPRTDSD